MSNKEEANRRNDYYLPTYNEICTSYRAIDDFRAKLLGFLPLVTGTGVFILLSDENKLSAMAHYLLPVGVFGILITIGLFAYELFGIKKCGALIEAGKQLEKSLGVIESGQFNKRPDVDSKRSDHPAFVTINEPFAAGIIYPAVLAAWTYVALICRYPNVAHWSPFLVFIVGFVSTLVYDYLLRKEAWLRAYKKPGNTPKDGASAA